MTSPDTLTRPELWRGVSQLVLTVGTVFGPLPTGGFGVLENMTSERVEAEGEEAGGRGPGARGERADAEGEEPGGRGERADGWVGR